MANEQELYEILENAPYGFKMTKGYLSKVLRLNDNKTNSLIRQCSDLYEEREELKLVEWHKFSPEPNEKRLAELNLIYSGMGQYWNTNLNRYQMLPLFDHSRIYVTTRNKDPGIEEIYKVSFLMKWFI